MSKANQEGRDKVIHTTPFIFWIFVRLYESLNKFWVDLPLLINNKNEVPRMFFEKSCIEFDCYISDKDIWGFWYQCSIEWNIYWRFSFYGKNKSEFVGNRHPYFPQTLSGFATFTCINESLSLRSLISQAVGTHFIWEEAE